MSFICKASDILKIFLLIAFFATNFSKITFATEVEIWNSSDGLKRLERSKFKSDFYQLINFYQAQINPLYCSAASSVMLLNAFNKNDIESQKALEVTKAEVDGGGIAEFKSYSQLTFFNDKTDKVKDRKIINYQTENQKGKFDPGLNLKDLSKILSQIYHLKTKVFYVKTNDQRSIDEFRNLLKKTLLDEKNFIIVNFDGKILGNATRGHISPLAAYDEESDSVLVLDVALHKNQWYFTKVTKLFEAMNSKDGDDYRGYILVWKN